MHTQDALDELRELMREQGVTLKTEVAGWRYSGAGKDAREAWRSFTELAEREVSDLPYQSCEEDMLLFTASSTSNGYDVEFSRTFTLPEPGEPQTAIIVRASYELVEATNADLPRFYECFGYGGSSRTDVSDDEHGEFANWSGRPSSWKTAIERSEAFAALNVLACTRLILFQDEAS